MRSMKMLGVVAAVTFTLLISNISQAQNGSNNGNNGGHNGSTGGNPGNNPGGHDNSPVAVAPEGDSLLLVIVGLVPLAGLGLWHHRRHRRAA